MTRAEKRRAMRAAGYRRAPGKRGRRSAIRARRAVEPEVSEFALARTNLLMPTPEQTMKVSRGR